MTTSRKTGKNLPMKNASTALDDVVLSRGLRMITGFDMVTDATPGWIGLRCMD